MDKFKKALAAYIEVLARSSIESKTPGDQSLYQFHLAQAALMFLAIEKDESIDKLKQIVGMVRQVYQLNPLRSPPGKAATDAFMIFASFVESA